MKLISESRRVYMHRPAHFTMSGRSAELICVSVSLCMLQLVSRKCILGGIGVNNLEHVHHLPDALSMSQHTYLVCLALLDSYNCKLLHGLTSLHPGTAVTP